MPASFRVERHLWQRSMAHRDWSVSQQLSSAGIAVYPPGA
jgi:hypothetical protein